MIHNGKGFDLANGEEITIKMKNKEVIIESSLVDNTDYDKSFEDMFREGEYRLSIDEQLNDLFKTRINPNK